MSGDTDETLFAPQGGYQVQIRDLSGANGSEPVETVRGFPSLAQANAFARRYVRDSLERCRSRGLSAADVLDAWFRFGEDATVTGADDMPVEEAWKSANDIKYFSSNPVTDSEERNWRILDPRRGDEDEPELHEEDGEDDR